MPIRNQFQTEAQFLEALRDWFAGCALTGWLACASPMIDDAGKKVKAPDMWLYADAIISSRRAHP